MIGWLKTLIYGPTPTRKKVPATVISKCFVCGSKCTQDVDDLNDYRFLPHCNWCLTVFDMDGKMKPTYGNTMEIVQIDSSEGTVVGEDIGAEFRSVGKDRPDRTMQHHVSKSLFEGTLVVTGPTGKGPWA